MPLLYVPTIYVLMLSVMVLLGALTFFAWLQNRAVRALAWWSGAVRVMAAALGLLCLRGTIPDVYSVDIAYVVLFSACALMLEDARCFEGKRPSPAVLLAGALAWIAACQIPPLYDSATARMIMVSAAVGSYSIGCAYVLWRGRAEPLLSRWPLIVLTALGGGLFLVRIPLALASPLAEAPITSFDALRSFWFAIVSTFTLLYFIAINYLFLALTKERSELAHKRASMTDALTGLANRRAFMEFAEQRLSAPASGTVAFLLFDLDYFKAINDSHGHSMGDRVLRLFAHTLSANLPRDSIAGRLGGEEFAAIVSGPDQQATIAAAERVRGSFAAAARIVDGVPIAATVSIGLAHAHDRPADIEALCERADKALYQAKALGRNRIESAVDELVPLVPDASVEADVMPAELPIPLSQQAQRAMKRAAA
ncbi:GGDEF domain-containing protein [Bradyrhizobium sp. WSM 1738]|uniref:GGDEF domain-containing protein n=1 Tax=Bradyrhizobium hereditatis TaxID=2821405 RepID=UPI001CE3559E|nr:GGDEF domain-containing protein [Bradyrhizobium hereditatis]MCA6119870.1 GGDEF domain-containing protein [Bradyrhizobium hereditatis]